MENVNLLRVMNSDIKDLQNCFFSNKQQAHILLLQTHPCTNTLRNHTHTYPELIHLSIKIISWSKLIHFNLAVQSSMSPVNNKYYCLPMVNTFLSNKFFISHTHIYTLYTEMVKCKTNPDMQMLL